MTTTAPLQYYFPGVDRPPAAWSWRFSDDSLASRLSRYLPGPLRGIGGYHQVTATGPAGSGCLAAPGAFDWERDHLAYDPDTHDWQEVEPGVWIGLAHDAQPLDYMRTTTAPRPTADGNYPATAQALTQSGRAWLIPIATLDTDHCHLPLVDGYIRGQWTSIPATPYRQLAADAITALAYLNGDTDLTRDQIRTIAIHALQANYALTPAELAHYGALSDDTYPVILAIITDAEARKKKAPPAKPSMTSGSRESSPTTAPPATIST